MTYPALIMVARGNHASGYQGVVRLVHGERDQAGDRDLVVCDHAHRLTRTARDCARRAAIAWSRYRRLSKPELAVRQRVAWDDWKDDDR